MCSIVQCMCICILCQLCVLCIRGVSWTLILGGGAKQGRSQNFGSGGNIKQSFINKFLSRLVLQWRRQNLGSGETFSKNVLIKDF